MLIRLAKRQDMKEVRDMYKYYVEHSNVTFAYQCPTPQEYVALFDKVTQLYPFLVCVCEGALVGYAYAHQHKEKEAYQWNVEITIYVHKDYHKQHIGYRLLDTLLSLLHIQHIRNVYSCITVPNDGSMALHKHFQFQEIARFEKTGYKQGTWLDVVWLQKVLCCEEHPNPIQPYTYYEKQINQILQNKNRSR